MRTPRPHGGGDDDIEQNLIFLQGASDDAHGGPGRDRIGGGVSQQFGDDGDDNVPCELTPSSTRRRR